MAGVKYIRRMDSRYTIAVADRSCRRLKSLSECQFTEATHSPTSYLMVPGERQPSETRTHYHHPGVVFEVEYQRL